VGFEIVIFKQFGKGPGLRASPILTPFKDQVEETQYPERKDPKLQHTLPNRMMSEEVLEKHKIGYAKRWRRISLKNSDFTNEPPKRQSVPKRRKKGKFLV